jgi:hypothetical protein
MSDVGLKRPDTADSEIDLVLVKETVLRSVVGRREEEAEVFVG